MANGTTRLALAQVQLSKEKAQSEQDRLMALSKKGAKMPKVPLKNPSEHNHSK